ncbi:transposase [Streptomyces tsukubensis]|uniref:transposase n=1 Tax=Streptomyces tsukubensis TaxID=83656 RepID=UPI0036AD3539
MQRHELTDKEWDLLAPLIPSAVTGQPRGDDRGVINGMVYTTRTGMPWHDLPHRYGPWKTVYYPLLPLCAERCLHPGPPADPGPS